MSRQKKTNKRITLRYAYLLKRLLNKQRQEIHRPSIPMLDMEWTAPTHAACQGPVWSILAAETDKLCCVPVRLHICYALRCHQQPKHAHRAMFSYECQRTKQPKVLLKECLVTSTHLGTPGARKRWGGQKHFSGSSPERKSIHKVNKFLEIQKLWEIANDM